MSQKQIIAKIQKAMESEPNKDCIKSIYLFGSYLHGNPKKNSDVDLLFEMKKTMRLFKIFAIQKNIEEKIGRKIDFIEKNSIDKYIKKDVLAEAKKIYEN